MKNEGQENYIKAIRALESEGEGAVPTNAIAERVQTTPASVTDMLKKLKARGLINYEKYKGVRLTPEGSAQAIGIVRKHRLWECFLVDKLKFGWHQVHEMAEQLEHIESTELTDRLDAFLGFPVSDPHGDPIPDAQGNYRINERTVELAALRPGERGRLLTVANSAASFLLYLDSKNIRLGDELKVENVYEFDRSMDILAGGLTVNMSEQVVKSLLIKKLN